MCVCVNLGLQVLCIVSTLQMLLCCFTLKKLFNVSLICLNASAEIIESIHVSHGMHQIHLVLRLSRLQVVRLKCCSLLASVGK